MGDKERNVEVVEVRGRELPLEFIQWCFDANEVGDGTLFSVLHPDSFIFNSFSKDDWYFWNQHHWKLDVHGRIYGAIEDVVEAYSHLMTAPLAAMAEEQEELKATKDKEEKKVIKGRIKELGAILRKIQRRIDRLRSVAGRKNTLEAARTGYAWKWRSTKDRKQAINIRPLAVAGNDLDANPWLLPVANGVIDLRTGRLLDGNPGDLLTAASPVEWRGIDEPCPVFESFLLEALGGDQEMVDYIQRVMGYALIGEVREHIFVVLYGARGRNGKTTLIETFYNVLGPLAGPVQSDMLLAQKYGRNSSGPSPDIMSMKGKRFVCASETAEGSKYDVARVKEITGGDRMQGRNSYDKIFTEWEPSHTLFMLTNTIPHAPAQDIAFKKRLRLIEFKYSFVPNPREEWERPEDPLLKKKLAAEYPGILAWAVRGSLIYQQEGLRDIPKVLQLVDRYMEDEDVIQDFMNECCEVGEQYSESIRELYHVFKMWWKNNVSKNPISKNLFSRRMALKVGRKRIRQGYPYFDGLCLRAENWDEYFSR